MPHRAVVYHSDVWYRTYHYLKYPALIMAGMLMTLASLWLMQHLIATGKKELNMGPTIRVVDFVRKPQEMDVRVKLRKATPPPRPDEPPPEIKMQNESVDVDNAWSTNFTPPGSIDINLSQSAAFSSDGEYLPILKVQPVYPTLALQRGWFGWVLLEFTVDESGKVIDPVVIENCVDTYSPGDSVLECRDRPGRAFDRAAKSAALKFKYKPRVVDGTPIETRGVRNIVSFILDEMIARQ